MDEDEKREHLLHAMELQILEDAQRVRKLPASAGASNTSTGKKQRKARGLDPGMVRRLHKELQRVESARERNGMELGLVDEDDVTEWRVRWYYDLETLESPTETQRALATQLAERGLPCIELRVDVPPGYPGAPPTARCYFPRVKGGFVFGDCGAICAEAHSSHGWVATSTIEALMTALRALMEGEGLRLQTLEHKDCTPKVLETPYDKEEAARGAAEVRGIHGDGYHGSAGSS